MTDIIFLTGSKQYNVVIRSGGVYQLAAWLRRFGYTTKIIDFCYDLDPVDIQSIIEKNIDSGTLAVGVSTTFWDTNEDSYNNIELERDDAADISFGASEPCWLIQVRENIEAKYKHVKWLLGGANSMNDFKLPWIVFHKYAEDSILKWMDEQKGIRCLRPDFNIKDTRKTYQDSDFIRPEEFLQLELGRGCIFKCKYCSFPMIGKKPGTYLRSYQDLRQEVLDNYERYGTTRYWYTDDTVNESEEKVQMLLELAQGLPFQIQWIGFCRADLIWARPHTANWLKDSGMRSTDFGIESFNKDSSKIIGKGWSGHHAKEWLLKQRQEWKATVSWELLMITGLPGWTPNELEADVKWLIENDMHSWAFNTLHINPEENIKAYHSEFDKQYKKYGYEFKGKNRINWTNGSLTRATVKQLTYDVMNKYWSDLPVGGFHLGDICSMGFDIDHVMLQTNRIYESDELRVKRQNFITRYVRDNLTN
jgi:radical SAM superfamily enzyme YgiQ (UPF0313 family)